MPKPIPLPADLRQQIGDEISLGSGRNELARRRHVSPGVVSKIARERGLWFDGCTRTAIATTAHQIDMWAEHVNRMEKLDAELDEIESKGISSSEPTRKYKRLTYARYNLERHHNGTYRNSWN